MPLTAFCLPKGHVLHAKRPSFATRKTAFCNALAIKTLQSWPVSQQQAHINLWIYSTPQQRPYRVQAQQRLRIKLKKHRTDIAASPFLTNNSPTFVRPYNHTNAGLAMQVHPQQECSLSLFNWLCPAATSAFSTNLLLQQQKERP